ncbi:MULTISPECIES: maltose alpha-D-glucosyltransferase [Halomonadaceae]|uniref:maltose alpha-D-glucosyltransferase n=1 Tax=Halomonadaceae TaxID=28256 RepID=UPI001598CE7A|nr:MULTISPECIES: maltose alpha-D-glucosyltransferase [Halomonas]QJQ95822.1 maltose alpha-D-glucosyltransferase [Halomonas sp. PA5]
MMDASSESHAVETMDFLDDPLWYKDAVIYQVHVKAFFDANDDGIGDFEGLIQKLDYIVSLGVNTIWILPFYPSPRRDDGYDIAEYTNVSPDYGTLEDARRFIDEAHRRGLRVLTELVINHTSDQHEWFQRARQAPPGSPEREFYVWSDTNQKYQGTRIIFLDTESSNWTWDPVANAYYWHRFYSHQPDLNFDNPQVLDEVIRVMEYWLDMGVDGLRLDAIPYLVERDGTNNENLPETHVVLKKIRAVIDERYPDRMLLAEANQWPEDTRPYFGDGDECHMAFHFPLMPRMYMALAQEDRFPITDILRQTPEIPATCQWAIFLRNHDELTLEMVTDKERDYLWSHYASDRRARINLGIRRRLAPLLERDRRRIELLNSLLLSMPGTPVLYYGDEIGMGDNIYLGDRDGVRTPMQWSVDRNGGFSRADPASLVLPPIMDPLYGYQTVNVEAQVRDPHSLLNSMRRLLAVRSQHRAFSRGTMRPLYPANRHILAYLREMALDNGETEALLCVANVARTAQAVELDLSAFAGQVPVEMVGGSAFPPIGKLSYLLTLPPYGFYWFLLAPESAMPEWHVPVPEPMPDYVTLIIKRRLDEIFQPTPRHLLESETLPNYLPKRRWFAAKQERIDQVHMLYVTRLEHGQQTMLISELEVSHAHGIERYQLPLAFLGEEQQTSALPQQLAMARVRRFHEVGLLTDALTLDAFALAVLNAMRSGASLPCDVGEIRFLPTSAFSELELPEQPGVVQQSAEQSNSSVIIDHQLVLKLFRRLEPGLHPEAEIGRYLTEHGFEHVAPLHGEVTRFDEQGTPQTLMILQGFIDNQGDAWSWTRTTLERAIREAVTDNETGRDSSREDAVYGARDELERFAITLGRRLGELHMVLASPTDNPAFTPELAGEAQVAYWTQRVTERVEEALALLERHKSAAGEAEQQLASEILAKRDTLLSSIGKMSALAEGSMVTRIHGDLHLGQVLVAHDDAYIIDFEGEPARPLEERRAKDSPLRDVAGMLRSFDYACAKVEEARPGGDSDEAQIDTGHEVAEQYLIKGRQEFLNAYWQATLELPHEWKQASGAAAAVDLFVLEKTAYEIAYEAANRPAWLGVPLRGLASIVAQLNAGEPNE